MQNKLKRHGYRYTKVYSVVEGVIRRCHDTNKDNYKEYGAKGIYVCDTWRFNREIFCKWLEDEGYREGLQIDRIDNDKGYSPDNCRLVPTSFNGINKKGSGKTGVCGVYFKEDCTVHPYLATISLFGIRYEIGRYKTLEEATDIRKIITCTVCEKAAQLCKENKAVSVEDLKPRLTQMLECVVRAVKGATV